MEVYAENTCMCVPGHTLTAVSSLRWISRLLWLWEKPFLLSSWYIYIKGDEGLLLIKKLHICMWTMLCSGSCHWNFSESENWFSLWPIWDENKIIGLKHLHVTWEYVWCLKPLLPSFLIAVIHSCNICSLMNWLYTGNTHWWYSCLHQFCTSSIIWYWLQC